MSGGTDEGGQRVQGHRGKSKWIKEGLADGKARKNYNHGQKSRDTFAFLGRFQIHTGPTLPSPHKQCWTHVSRIFSKFQLCIGLGGGRTERKVRKGCTALMREQRNDRKI